MFLNTLLRRTAALRRRSTLHGNLRARNRNGRRRNGRSNGRSGASGLLAPLDAASGPARRVLVVIDDDADAGALGARAELDLRPLDERGLGVLQGAVEALDVALRDGCGCVGVLGGFVWGLGDLETRFDFLALAAEDGGDFSCLGCLLVSATEIVRFVRTYVLLLDLFAVGAHDDGALGAAVVALGCHVAGRRDGRALEGRHEGVDVGLAAEGDLTITDHQRRRVGAEVDVERHGADKGSEAGEGEHVAEVYGEHVFDSCGMRRERLEEKGGRLGM